MRKWKRFITKTYVAGATAFMTVTSIEGKASATAPSSYVNKITDGLFGQILAVAPKIAVLVIGFALLMYIMSGDEHKKSKHKTTAVIAIVAYLVLLVLKPLLGWLGGLV